MKQERQSYSNSSSWLRPSVRETLRGAKALR
ncbi:hypothetical protein M892_17820 [Vibrio campbellii ATCC BAA-1116]|nr:hypothetical protein M892_17820 [Vibrio campbellii ATCC BAA-1116]